MTTLEAPIPRRVSTLKKAIALGLLTFFAVVIAADVYAIRFSHFVPSARWAQISFWIGLPSAICGIASGFLPLPSNGSPPFTPKSVWVRAPASGLAFFGFGYFAFLSGLPAWYTAVAGTFYSQDVTVKGWQTSVGGRWCSGPYLEEAPRQITVCLSPTLRTSTPPGTRLVLEGKGTALGINVRSVDIQSGRILWTMPSAIHPDAATNADRNVLTPPP